MFIPSSSSLLLANSATALATAKQTVNIATASVEDIRRHTLGHLGAVQIAKEAGETVDYVMQGDISMCVMLSLPLTLTRPLGVPAAAPLITV